MSEEKKDDELLEIVEPDPVEPQKELTEEEQKKVDEFLESMYRARYGGYLSKIEEYINKHHLTVEEAVKEVEEKRSGLSSLARDILVATKIKLLKKWFGYERTD